MDERFDHVIERFDDMNRSVNQHFDDMNQLAEQRYNSINQRLADAEKARDQNPVHVNQTLR